MLEKIIKEDGPALSVCGSIFTYCTLANVATVAQQIGVIAAAIGAVVVCLHRIWLFMNDGKEK